MFPVLNLSYIRKGPLFSYIFYGTHEYYVVCKLELCSSYVYC